jgi:hypothetical protein
MQIHIEKKHWRKNLSDHGSANRIFRIEKKEK